MYNYTQTLPTCTRLINPTAKRTGLLPIGHRACYCPAYCIEPPFTPQNGKACKPYSQLGLLS